MDENLQRLARELRKEVCPQRVHDEVARRLTAQAPAPSLFRYAMPLAAASIVLLCAFAGWRWAARENTHRQPELPAQPALDRVKVATQVEAALGLIGTVLLDAGDHSQRAIFKEAVPPLRNSLETIKDKTSHLIKL